MPLAMGKHGIVAGGAAPMFDSIGPWNSPVAASMQGHLRQLEPHAGERFVIQFLEPVAGNGAAIGLDIASEARRCWDCSTTSLTFPRSPRASCASMRTRSRSTSCSTTCSAVPCPFDALVMDIQMPGMDGFEATRLLRTRAGLTALPIIAMTANASLEDRQRCFDAGMGDHVAKLLRLVRGAPQAMDEGGALPLPLEAAGSGASRALARLGGNVANYRKVVERFAPECASLLAQLAAAGARAVSHSAVAGRRRTAAHGHCQRLGRARPVFT